MAPSRIVAQLGLVAAVGCSALFVAVITIGSWRVSAVDLRSHGASLLAHSDRISSDLARTLAITPRR